MDNLKKSAGLFDPVSNTLSSDMWDGFALKAGVKESIIAHLNEVLPFPVSVFQSITLIGSMLGYQFSKTSDIDIGVQLKPEHDDLFDQLRSIFKQTNGWDLPGTLHPINFFPAVSGRKFRLENLTAGYDLLNQVWVKPPTKPTAKDMRRLSMDMPYLNLRRNELKRQLAQLVDNPNKAQESIEVAKEFQRLDTERKQGYEYPGLKAGTKSLQNATYKYTLKPFDDHVIEKLYHVLRSKGLTFHE
jgi:hypothetical protein